MQTNRSHQIISSAIEGDLISFRKFLLHLSFNTEMCNEVILLQQNIRRLFYLQQQFCHKHGFGHCSQQHYQVLYFSRKSLKVLLAGGGAEEKQVH